MNNLPEKVSSRIQVDAAGCWLWQGAVSDTGYGTIYVGSGRKDRKTKLLHRFCYEQSIGPIPLGRDLDHLCRVRRCCNPAHLEPVTRQENVLRGDAGVQMAAFHRSKTHCKNGHPYDDANTLISRQGHRRCRKCRAAYDRTRHRD
jgi:hypothetical protein